MSTAKSANTITTPMITKRSALLFDELPAVGAGALDPAALTEIVACHEPVLSWRRLSFVPRSSWPLLLAGNDACAPTANGGPVPIIPISDQQLSAGAVK